MTVMMQLEVSVQVSSEFPVPCINSITIESAMSAFDHLYSFLP